MIDELEKVRKKAVNKTLKILLIFFIISVGLFFVFPGLIIFGIIIGSIVSVLATSKDKKAYYDMYKREIVVKTFDKICTNVKFDLDKGISYGVIAKTGMMRMGDTYSSNDHVIGQYKNTNFEMSDVWIQEEYTDSDGDTHYYTIFKGQWYIFDFNKYFKANIQVCEKTFRNAKRNSLFVKEENKLKKVELEDMEFNKTFKVYAQNELEAFYILTPNTMEKIKTVNNKIKGHLLLCFIDNKLHVGLYNNKDFFETSIFKKVNVEEATKKTLGEISIITDFVDILSLDNDLFKF